MKNKQPTMDELNAGNKFRDSVIHRADGHLGIRGSCVREIPYWHGWVIMDAFLAGVEYEKTKMTNYRHD